MEQWAEENSVANKEDGQWGEENRMANKGGWNYEGKRIEWPIRKMDQCGEENSVANKEDGTMRRRE